VKARVRELATRLVRAITDHYTMLVSAGVAFYSMLALVPGVIALVTVYSFFSSPAQVEDHLSPLTDALPQEVADLVIRQLTNATSLTNDRITLGLLVSALAVIWAMSNAMNSLVMSIRIAHEAPSPHNWIQGRIFAIKISLLSILSAAAILWLVAITPRAASTWGLGDQVRLVIAIVRWPLAITASVVGQSLLYRLVLGRAPAGLRGIATTGAAVATTVWIGGTFALAQLAAELGSAESVFGSLGTVAALLGWLYLSAFSVLFGAEIDAQLHQMRTERPA
jgi:membrane protein